MRGGSFFGNSVSLDRQLKPIEQHETRTRSPEAIGGTPFIVINRDALIRFRYRFIPDHVIGELLAKRWMDNAIPFLALIVVLIVFGRILPDFYSISNITDLSRQFAETGLVVLGRHRSVGRLSLWAGCR